MAASYVSLSRPKMQITRPEVKKKRSRRKHTPPPVNPSDRNYAISSKCSQDSVEAGSAYQNIILKNPISALTNAKFKV
ncbi:hypothetical protein JI664_02580 [Rhodobacter sp. NTK016B]|uniref:hypothetical protein n=1 Tax=Rhodobacter sp. NTK016B TaxID=2759676 RepID=UPI001A8FBDF4|nr:hypothetical protein [Rhodobacter sp. NTK016B]MBN8290841.1 hypothetical protein [Rhodobacter sp. NTK016B]